MFDEELDRFKTQINLVEYATSECGYQRIRRESSRSSQVLRHPQTDDKVIVARDNDGHWIYFSVRNERDNGSIIDFVQGRQRKNLGEVRKALREWARMPRLDSAKRFPCPEVSPRQRDSHAVVLALAAAKYASNSLYLNSRGIRPETLQTAQFAGSWKEDARGNVLFVHRNQDGVTGFEIKNQGFTGFSKGGTKTLWLSASRPDEQTLVVTESAIDALSYYQLKPTEKTRFASLGGAPGPETLELLDRLFAKLAPESMVIAAMDADADGLKLASKLGELAARHPHVTFREDRPTLGKDWNAVLQRVEQDYIRSVAFPRAKGLGR